MKKFFYCLPRFLATLMTIIIYLLILEVFIPGVNLNNVFGRFMFASFILLITSLSWTRPKFGGLIFTIFGFIYLFITISEKSNWARIIFLSLIPIIIGILFLFEGLKKES